ncbi:MAG: radical SAM protein [Bacilli bacterium]|nr:radical SAM protein [Bacilli bacterium]MDD4282507.1 radical SAM protein [Bacilli bacterium]MDD4718268.1 radical SAM protein [Bacilli bacterium]
MIKDLCFEIIQKCPNNCIFCSSLSSIDCERIISFDIIKKTIDKLLSIAEIKEISISGGEPFFHPELFQIVEYFKQKEIKTIIYTSGITKRKKINEQDKNNLNKYNIKIINQIEENDYDCINRETLRELKELGLDKIVFDFQASEVDEYNYLMGTKNQYANVLKSILNTNLEGIESEIHFIPMLSNYKFFPEIVELAELGGVSRISILRFVPQGRGRKNLDSIMLSVEQLNEFKNIVKNTKMTNVDIRNGIPMLDEDNHLCTAGYDKCVIRYDGVILPCPAFKDTDLQILKDNGMQIYNIHENLEDINFHEGSRKTPLCKKIHFKNK